MKYTRNQIAGLIDHSSLKGYATWENVRKLLDEAMGFKTYSVCIEPLFSLKAKEYLKDHKSNVKVDITLDFPLGVYTTGGREKLIDTYSGSCDEVDLVVQTGYVKSGMFVEVEHDVNTLVDAAHSHGIAIKFITEDAYTSLEEKRKLYEIICRSKADYIKTSTGFAEAEFAGTLGNRTGAGVENVKLMAETIKRVNSPIGIKVAGGIKSYSEAIELLEASGMPPDPKKFRLGVSRTSQILSEI
jgi:deoxyribose-phosphate aldolase